MWVRYVDFGEVDCTGEKNDADEEEECQQPQFTHAGADRLPENLQSFGMTRQFEYAEDAYEAYNSQDCQWHRLKIKKKVYMHAVRATVQGRRWVLWSNFSSWRNRRCWCPRFEEGNYAWLTMDCVFPFDSKPLVHLTQLTAFLLFCYPEKKLHKRTELLRKYSTCQLEVVSTFFSGNACVEGTYSIVVYLLTFNVMPVLT